MDWTGAANLSSAVLSRSELANVRRVVHMDGVAARVLGLHGGSGALGLEARSRGAVYADTVDTDPKSLRALEQNIADIRAGELFFFQAEDGIRDYKVTGVQTCALPI